MTKKESDNKKMSKHEVAFGLYYGQPQKLVEAFPLMLELAEEGDIVAQAHVGRMYYYGYGVERDPKKGFDWCVKAAEQGNIVAKYELRSFSYDNHLSPKDKKTARKWGNDASQNHPVDESVCNRCGNVNGARCRACM